jgi:hypothetical protein
LIKWDFLMVFQGDRKPIRSGRKSLIRAWFFGFRKPDFTHTGGRFMPQIGAARPARDERGRRSAIFAGESNLHRAFMPVS